MAPEPTTEDISKFCEFTGLDANQDRALIVSALKSNSDLAALMSEYFEDSASFRRKYAWDDSAFGADRDGGTANTVMPFDIEPLNNSIIHGVTAPPENYYGPSIGAPSRPPSRINNRSPLGAPSNFAQEDEDLQWALRESAVESGLTPQQAGITNTSAKATYFGPANRNDYDQDSWAMVTTAVDVSQGDMDPAPSARKREEGAPAFLIQNPNARHSYHRLASVLTILHEIPLARNVLLAAGQQAASYGHNSEWWKGQPIFAASALVAMQQGDSQLANDSKPNFHEEIHRLMAFLDQTERSYGSAEVIADLVPETTYTLERQFHDTLKEKTDPEIMKPLTHLAFPISTETLEDAQESTRFAFLSFELSKDQYEHIKTLYEAWDWLMWNDTLTWQEFTPGSKMVVLADMGEVMTIVLDGNTPEIMDVPEVWYPERYLVDRKEEAKVIQEHTAWVLGKLYKAKEDEYGYTQWLDEDNTRVYNKREMLEKIIKEYDGQVQYLDGLGRFRELQKSVEPEKPYIRLENVPCVKTAEEEELSKNAEQMVNRCKSLMFDMDEKLAMLNWERERLIERQRLLGKLLTDPDKPGLNKPFTGKKYFLRGVSTGKNITYVCKRNVVNLIESDEQSSANYQWWRLSYTAGDAQPAKTEKVSIDLVMRQMFQETKNPLLVYATEDAVTQSPAPLSDALQRFVRAENKNFRQELNRENTDETANARNITSNMSPISPSKRKYRSGSVDSMATNRASHGDSDGNSRIGDFDTDLFGIDHGNLDTEMTDFSISDIPDTGNKSLVEVMYSGETQEPAQNSITQLAVPQQTETSADVSTNGAVEISRTVTPETGEQPKSPEMQERNSNGGGSPFMPRLSVYRGSDHDPRDEQKTKRMMDMEIPDEHQEDQ